MTGFLGFAAIRSYVRKTAIGDLLKNTGIDNDLFKPSSEENISKHHQSTSTFTLSYLGDACYELWCRKLVTHRYSNPNQVHRKTVQLVRCQSQSKLIELLLPLLTEEEKKVYTKGKNTRPNNVPKSATVEEYRKSTGFECLVGYWLIRDEAERFNELMNDETVQPFIESFLTPCSSLGQPSLLTEEGTF